MTFLTTLPQAPLLKSSKCASVFNLTIDSSTHITIQSCLHTSVFKSDLSPVRRACVKRIFLLLFTKLHLCPYNLILN